MLFNSLTFLVFLPAVWLLYRLVGRSGGYRGQNLLLLVASYVFYGWWDVRFLHLVVLSTALDYSAGLYIQHGRLRRVEKRKASALLIASVLGFLVAPNLLHPEELLGVPTLGGAGGALLVLALIWLGPPLVADRSLQARRRAALILSLCGNLGILFAFKYFGFFLESLGRVLGDETVAALRLDLVLPVGISFYTFQTLSYTIDIHRGKLKACGSILDFALFVAYFPQLVAGPIERASRLLPALRSERIIDSDQLARGMHLILLGFVKKVALADGLARTVNAAFALQDPSALEVCVGTVAFAAQIYGDFSGYSDIARGVSKLFGIELMTNFREPYFSTNPQEFWRRWHISLSTWLRDYLYISLGGNRGGPRLVYRNLMLTMLLGGLWHGAAWNFVLWGAFHGTLLCVHRAFASPEPPTDHALVKALKIGAFFVITCYGWLLFRATSLEQVGTFTEALVMGWDNRSLVVPPPRLSAVAAVLVIAVYDYLSWRRPDRRFYLAFVPSIRGLFYAASAITVLMGLSNDQSEFIYFQF